jgi:hypothetical protein
LVKELILWQKILEKEDECSNITAETVPTMTIQALTATITEIKSIVEKKMDASKTANVTTPNSNKNSNDKRKFEPEKPKKYARQEGFFNEFIELVELYMEELEIGENERSRVLRSLLEGGPLKRFNEQLKLIHHRITMN